MNFIDSHHHIWIPEQYSPDLGYRWLRDIGAMKPFGDPTAIQRDYTFDEYRGESERHQLRGSVYVQVDGAIEDPLAETAWVDSVFDKSELVHAIVALVDLSNKDAPRQIEAQAQFSRVRGIRQIIARLDAEPELCFAPEHWLRHALWRENFARLAEHQLSFDLQLYPEQMLEAAEFLEQHPGVPIIVDHSGCAHDASSKGFEQWCDGVALLSKLSHVSMKLSGFGMYDSNWNSESIHAQIKHLYACFGAERLLFGSNYPVDKLMRGFDAVLDSVKTALLSVVDETQADDVIVSGADSKQSVSSQRVLEQVFSSNARRVYRLG